MTAISAPYTVRVSDCGGTFLRIDGLKSIDEARRFYLEALRQYPDPHLNCVEVLGDNFDLDCHDGLNSDEREYLWESVQ